MLLSAVSVLVVAQSSSEIPEGLMNNPVLAEVLLSITTDIAVQRDVQSIFIERQLSNLPIDHARHSVVSTAVVCTS